MKRAVWSRGEWTGVDGWRQEFESDKAGWDTFTNRPLALETPDYFETEQPIAELMTVPQLKDHIDELSASGFNIVPLSVDLQKKLAFPFVTVVMTLLAIPFGLTTGKRGTLYGSESESCWRSPTGRSPALLRRSARPACSARCSPDGPRT